MKFKAVEHPLLAKPRRYLTSAAMVVVAVGLTGALLSAVSTVQRNQSLMTSRAITASGALLADEIRQLTGSSNDTESPTYQSLKRRLARIRQENTDMRHIYLLGQRPNGQIFYYVDSETQDSRYSTAPGQLYSDASSSVRAAFVEDAAFLEGPYADSFGTWISAVAPIVDEQTGEIVALLGIDVNAYDYYLQIATYALVPLLLAAIPLSVLLRNRRLEAKEREVVELKSQFVSVASHELRAPLTGALWGVQSLLKSDKNLTSKQKRTLSSIFSNIATSLASVNEVLDFSLFEKRKTSKLQRLEVDLVTVLGDTQKLLSLSAQESDVNVKKIGNWPTAVSTTGDPSALKRAFANILSNAIKYSRPDTAIELRYYKREGSHVISIKDHGIGIPQDELHRVLNGYYRASNASKQQAHGTGMGLLTTRLIIEQHKGRLWLESKVNHGTTVYIKLPANRQLPQSDRQ